MSNDKESSFSRESYNLRLNERSVRNAMETFEVASERSN